MAVAYCLLTVLLAAHPIGAVAAELEEGFQDLVVRRFLDQFGFDTVDAGPLKEGWRIQRDWRIQ